MAGWSQNTANRRVLVIHSNGSSEVVEIQNDLGLKADDIQGMIERLTKQGVQDIAKIELYGLTNSASITLKKTTTTVK